MIVNNIITVPLLYIIYDFFYTIFHRSLHRPSIYRFIHKHHHRQFSPTRGFNDAMNVHPFEYITGQYNHIFAIYLLGKIYPVHVTAIITFMLLGMLMAGLNHTRLDVGYSRVYDVKYHDAHHRFSECNYGQYLVFWDKLTGSFRESRIKKNNSG